MFILVLPGKQSQVLNYQFNMRKATEFIANLSHSTVKLFLIGALFVSTVANIVNYIKRTKAFERGHISGYAAGLAKGNSDCAYKIQTSNQTIQKDAEEKTKIFSEPASDAYKRFKLNTGSKDTGTIFRDGTRIKKGK